MNLNFVFLLFTFFCISVSAETKCPNYLVELERKPVLTLQTKKLMEENLIYGPWYYSTLLKLTGEEERSGYLAGVSAGKLAEISTQIVYDFNDNTSSNFSVEQKDTLELIVLRSLKNIQLSKEYPFKEYFDWRDILRKKKVANAFFKVASGFMLLTPFIIYSTEMDIFSVPTLWLGSGLYAMGVAEYFQGQKKYRLIRITHAELKSLIAFSDLDPYLLE